MGAKAVKIKYLPIRAEQLEGLEELRTGGLDELRRLVRFAKASRLSDPLQVLFEMALVRYYDPENPNGDLEDVAGHVLYRLSDLVPQQARALMPVRGPVGSLRHTGPSLEDWRAEWAAKFPKGEAQIPHLPGDPIELPGLV